MAIGLRVSVDYRGGYATGIARLRNEHDPPMSLARLAQLSGVNARTILRIETGKRIPTLATRRKLLAVFGIEEARHEEFFGRPK